MIKQKKPFLLAIAFIILIFLVYGFFSYFVNDTKIIRTLRPTRDVLFFPFMSIIKNTDEIYCGIAKTGILDYERCIKSTGPGISMREGSPSWFDRSVLITSLLALILYYTVIFKIVLKITKKFHSIT